MVRGLNSEPLRPQARERQRGLKLRQAGTKSVRAPDAADRAPGAKKTREDPPAAAEGDENVL